MRRMIINTKELSDRILDIDEGNREEGMMGSEFNGLRL